LIEAKELSKSYSGRDAVRGVSFEIRPGEIVGLLGPNGAGKTTIMKVLTCYHFPTSGQARIDGFDVTERPLEVKRRVGYLPENAPLYSDLSVAEYLSFVADARALEGARRTERLEYVVGKCGLESVLYKTIDTLSKGFRQRVGLAQAIVHDPDILILDEPTTGLDPNQIIEIRALIKELGKEKTVILSTHILQEVEAVCDRVLILSDGLIAAQGTTREIGAMLSGNAKARFVALIKGAKAKDAESRAARIGKLAALESATQEGADVRLTLSLDSAEGDGSSVFAWAVAEGLTLSSLEPQRLSLEDIFVKLTTEGEGK
jgi:ABC-2 type transport system ATP-binding protein